MSWEPHLEPGERLLWEGRPMRRSTAYWASRGLFWAAAVLALWVLRPAGGYGPTFAILLILLAALAFASSLSLSGLHVKGDSPRYALTSQRALLLTPGGELRSEPLHGGPAPMRGRGRSVLVGRELWFRDVDRPEELRKLIRQVQEGTV